MAKSKAAIKSRIKSINTTKKITGAMELISNIKLQKHLSMLEKNKLYASTMVDVLENILSLEGDFDSKYIFDHKSNKKFYFVFLSDLGLCGGYNINICKYIADNLDKNDYYYLIGSASTSLLNKKGFKFINEELIYSDEVDYQDIKKMMDMALKMYLNDEICSIEVVYTKFVNNVTFMPEAKKILPLEIHEGLGYKQMLIEPNESEVLDNLIPLVCVNNLYNCFIQTKTSEHGSRRFAMENATDNANELIDDLTLAFNQARQAAITQEITEIIGGADAL